MRNYSLFFLFLCIGARSFAQENFPSENSRISVGITVGRSTTKAFGPEVDSQLEPYQSPYSKSVSYPVLHEDESLTISGGVKFRLTKLLFAKSGLGFLRKGTWIENMELVYPMNVKNDYIILPLILVADPLKLIFSDDGISLSVEGGITPSLPIKIQRYTPSGPQYRSHVKSKRVVVALQWGATLEIAITEKIFLTGNYSAFRDVNEFYFNPDTASGSPAGRKMYFQGYWITGGIGYAIR